MGWAFEIWILCSLARPAGIEARRSPVPWLVGEAGSPGSMYGVLLYLMCDVSCSWALADALLKLFEMSQKVWLLGPGPELTLC